MNTLIIVALFVSVMVAGIFFAYSRVQSNTTKAEPQEGWTKSCDEEEIKRLRLAHDVYRKGTGKLNEPCPCADDFYCSNGSCKIRDGNSCAYSSDCSQTSFCFHTVCTPKPPLQQGEDLYISGTPMVLEGTRFNIPATWWSIRDIIDLCPSPLDKDAYYALHEKGLVYRIYGSPKIHGRTEIPQMTWMERIFLLDKKIYGVAKGLLYQLENETDRTWCWAQINKFHGFDLNRIYIFHVATVGKTISLVTTEGLWSYDPAEDHWAYDSKIVDVAYGSASNVMVARYRDGTLRYHDKEEEHELPAEAVDFAVDPKEEKTVYIVDERGFCFSNVYKQKDGADHVSIRLVGNIRKLVQCHQKIWGISNYSDFEN